MKTIGKLKLTQLSKADLEARQMNALRGGGTPGDCGCGCHYADTGGSQFCDNSNANNAKGQHSYGGDDTTCSCTWEEKCISHDFWNGYGPQQYG